MKKLTPYYFFLGLIACALLSMNATAKNMQINKKVTIDDTLQYYAPAYISKNGKPVSYPSGETAIMLFLQSHMKPVGHTILTDSGNTGATKLLINFEVEKDGSISDVLLLRDDDHPFDVELVRVIKLTKWNPAFDNGRTLRSGHNLSVYLVSK
jgi:hypothetical protein